GPQHPGLGDGDQWQRRAQDGTVGESPHPTIVEREAVVCALGSHDLCATRRHRSNVQDGRSAPAPAPRLPFQHETARQTCGLMLEGKSRGDGGGGGGGGGGDAGTAAWAAGVGGGGAGTAAGPGGGRRGWGGWRARTPV